MDKEQLISVIVPVYNTAPWLRRCLDSICAQPYRNLEILCVNDGSTDNSAEILAEYEAADSRIKVFTQENAGLSAARNTALAHAAGEWVTGVDSDDYLEPDIFRRAMCCAADQVDMVAFGVRCVWENEEKHPEIFEQYAADEVQPMSVELASGLLVCFWNKLWRRSVITEHSLRFPHGLVHEDDAFFYQFVPYARQVAMCEAVGYNYAQRTGSITKSGQTELETATRYTLVMRYVFKEYVNRGIVPEDSPWFRLFVTRVYADCYHVVPAGQRGNLNELFYSLLLDLGMLALAKRDYRFRRMVPICGWRGLFLSRYLYTELWRFFRIPVWRVDYESSCVVSRRFILWDWACRKLKSFFMFSYIYVAVFLIGG